jgi:hypothetical protein
MYKFDLEVVEFSIMFCVIFSIILGLVLIPITIVPLLLSLIAFSFICSYGLQKYYRLHNLDCFGNIQCKKHKCNFEMVYYREKGDIKFKQKRRCEGCGLEIRTKEDLQAEGIIL